MLKKIKIIEKSSGHLFARYSISLEIDHNFDEDYLDEACARNL